MVTLTSILFRNGERKEDILLKKESHPLKADDPFMLFILFLLQDDLPFG
ncbi:hypothetical protein ACEQPO_05230 [Bacillus sp. SL00103]